MQHKLCKEGLDFDFFVDLKEDITFIKFVDKN